MSKFFSDLSYEPVEGKEGVYRLTHALIYGSDCANVTIVVPLGMETDLVTGRKLLFVRRIVQERMYRAAVVHDYLYGSAMTTRKVADDVFYEAMLVDGVAKWRAWAAWAAVRAFASSHYRDQ